LTSLKPTTLLTTQATKRNSWLRDGCTSSLTAGFASGIALEKKVGITEISVNQMLNEPEKLEGKAVAEITVTGSTYVRSELLVRV